VKPPRPPARPIRVAAPRLWFYLTALADPIFKRPYVSQCSHSLRLAHAPASSSPVRSQSWRVGRAVLGARVGDYGRAAACRGLPALPPPGMTEALLSPALSILHSSFLLRSSHLDA
jgi:hypothetical protein